MAARVVIAARGQFRCAERGQLVRAATHFGIDELRLGHGSVVVKLPHHRSQIASPIDIGGKNIERRDDDVGIECAARQSKEKERARRRSGGA